MKLKFTKMHGAGNDFIVIDAINQRISLCAAQCRFLADRRFGVGADQILLVEASSIPEVDFRYRIFNADGSEVEQCGNGARAFVKFVTEKKLSNKSSIKVETTAGMITLTLEPDGNVTVNMGAPILAPSAVPFDTTGLHGQLAGCDTLWPLKLTTKLKLTTDAETHDGLNNNQDKSVLISVISMGNPHAVQIVADIDLAAVAIEGPCIEHHPRFPHRVNAGFMQIMDQHHIKLRVYERGAGETLACGSGACAAVVAGIRRGLLHSPVQVTMRGGQLMIAWQGENQAVLMTGPAVSVFDGEIDI